MQMNKIKERLETIFDKHRIIVWYDQDESFRDDFESLDLNVEKIEINNNEFGVKVRVLHKQKNDKFLLYIPKKEPPMEDNWLLDIELGYYKFSADPVSLILQELGFDVSKKAFIAEHRDFFNSKVRMEKYKSMLDKNDNDNDLVLKMAAVVLGCDEKIESILLALIAKSEKIKELDKYSLTDKLFRIFGLKFSYHSPLPSMDDFVYKLLQNHFYGCVDSSKCELNKEAVLFVKSWMDSFRRKELFEEISNRVQNELKVENIITDYEFDDLTDCDTYEICERAIISELKDRIMAQSISLDEFEEYLNKRRDSFWFDKYKNIYKTFKYALKLLDSVSDFEANIDSFDDGIAKYASSWYRIDYFYRNFAYYFNQAEHSEIVKPLSFLEDVYLNDYLRKLNDKWQKFVKDYHIGYNHQRKFYNKYVEPVVQKSQKIFVVISDALRYECAKELSRLISYENTAKRSFQVNDSYMISSLPSYTQLGMASLLCHDELEIREDDTVYADKASTKGKAAREKMLQKKHKTAVLNDEEFLRLNAEEGRELTKNNSVIYIYHNQIDAVGDKQISEDKVFDAAKSSFETLKRIVKQIANFNGTNIVLTADHGFLYTNKPTQESEFCSIDTSLMDVFRVDRRFIMGKKVNEDICAEKFNSKELGLSCDNEFLIAKSINKIRKQGGGNRFVHGGATLQELVIPLVEIKYVRKNIVKEVDVSVMQIPPITTNSVNISLFQREAVDLNTKPISLTAAFYAEDGIMLSDMHKVVLDSKDKEDRNREIKLIFTFKEIAKNYNNRFIKFVLKKILKNSSEEPVYKSYDVKLQLSFFNEFDEF